MPHTLIASPFLDGHHDASLGDQAAREALRGAEKFGHLRHGQVAVSHVWVLLPFRERVRGSRRARLRRR
jgi:hypothetical protein